MSAFDYMALWVILAILIAMAIRGMIWATQPPKRTMLDDHYRDLEEQ